MAWTQADIDTLRTAMLARQFVHTLTFENETVTFDSVDDQLKLLSIMTAAVATAAGQSRTRYAVVDKGV